MKSQTIDAFGLGAVEQPLPGDERYQGRLAIPYETRSGIVNMRYRCILDHDCKVEQCPKYMGPPGLTAPMFNVGVFLNRHESFVCTTEGEMDAIAAAQAGLPAVAIPGVGAWQRFYSLAFRGYKKVFVLADDDEPGRKFADKVAADVAPYVGLAKVVVMRGGDVNDVVRRDGEEALRAAVGL